MKLPKLRFKDDLGYEFPGFEMNILGDVSDVRDGTHDSPIYHPQGYPLITSRNLLDNGEIDLENVNLISEADFININKRSKVDSGDILFGMIGTIGNPVIVKSANFAIKNVALIKEKNKLQNIFLVQYLKSNAALRQFDNVTVGNSQKFIALGKLRQLEIQIPCLNEQTKIANFLGAVDEKITHLTQKYDLLAQYKKGVMQQIFSQELRFRDEDGSEFPDWEEKNIGEVLTIGSGKDYKHLSAGTVPVYGTGGHMLSVNEYLYDGESVCIGRKGTIDKPILLNGKFWTVDTLFYTHSFRNCIPKFIYAVFQQIDWKNYNEASGVPSLSKSTIEKIKISLPSIEEQIKIANLLTALDYKISQTQAELDVVKQYKQGLLQQMFV